MENNFNYMQYVVVKDTGRKGLYVGSTESLQGARHTVVFGDDIYQFLDHQLCTVPEYTKLKEDTPKTRAINAIAEICRSDPSYIAAEKIYNALLNGNIPGLNVE